jgi:hypothetical protein
VNQASWDSACARIAELEAEVARLNREVRKWQSRRMVAEQKLGYEEKLRARAEATLAAERARVEQMEPVWLTAMMAVRFYHELGSEFDCAGGMRSIAEAVDATRPAPEEE